MTGGGRDVAAPVAAAAGRASRPAAGEAARGVTAGPARLLALQRAAGNAAVSSLFVQRSGEVRSFRRRETVVVPPGTGWEELCDIFLHHPAISRRLYFRHDDGARARELLDQQSNLRRFYDGYLAVDPPLTGALELTLRYDMERTGPTERVSWLEIEDVVVRLVDDFDDEHVDGRRPPPADGTRRTPVDLPAAMAATQPGPGDLAEALPPVGADVARELGSRVWDQIDPSPDMEDPLDVVEWLAEHAAGAETGPMGAALRMTFDDAFRNLQLADELETVGGRHLGFADALARWAADGVDLDGLDELTASIRERIGAWSLAVDGYRQGARLARRLVEEQQGAGTADGLRAELRRLGRDRPHIRERVLSIIHEGLPPRIAAVLPVR